MGNNEMAFGVIWLNLVKYRKVRIVNRIRVFVVQVVSVDGRKGY